MAIQNWDWERRRIKEKDKISKDNYGFICEKPELAGGILILDTHDHKLATIATLCYGGILQDLGLKLGYLDVCFTMKGVVSKIETVAKLFDEMK